eukprot:UN21691
MYKTGETCTPDGNTNWNVYNVEMSLTAEVDEIITGQIDTDMDPYKNTGTLGEGMVADIDGLARSLFLNHQTLTALGVNADAATKLKVYNWYKTHVNTYAEYFKGSGTVDGELVDWLRP